MKKAISGVVVIASLGGVIIIAGGVLLGGITFRDWVFSKDSYVYPPPPPITWNYNCGPPRGTLGVTCRIKGGSDILVFISKDRSIVGLSIDNQATIASPWVRRTYKAAVDDGEPSEWNDDLSTEAESVRLAYEMLDGAVLPTGFVDF